MPQQPPRTVPSMLMTIPTREFAFLLMIVCWSTSSGREFPMLPSAPPAPLLLAPTCSVDILQPLLEDLPGLTQQLIGLRECLPGVNLSQ